MARTGLRGADGIARYRNRPRTVIELLRASVDDVPNRKAVIEIGGEHVTYQQLWDRAARVAGGLHANGGSPGERIAIRLANGLDWVVAFFGGLMAGAVVVPVNTRLAAFLLGFADTSTFSRAFRRWTDCRRVRTSKTVRGRGAGRADLRERRLRVPRELARPVQPLASPG